MGKSHAEFCASVLSLVGDQNFVVDFDICFVRFIELQKVLSLINSCYECANKLR